MTKYYVHVFETYRSKYEVDADSMAEACRFVAEDPDNYCLMDRENADEITCFCVDVVGDEEYLQTKYFNDDYEEMKDNVSRYSLCKFARWVLFAMTNDEEWDADTADGIAREAKKLGLAKAGNDAMFIGLTHDALERGKEIEAERAKP